MPLEAAGKCRKTGETWPITEFKEVSTETEITPASSNNSSPIRARRKLFSGVAVLCLEASAGHMQKEQERNQHDQPEKQQFGLSGAHGLKSTFSGRRFKSEVRLTGVFRTWQRPRVAAANSSGP
jgi:hypothetical protein